MKKRYMRPKTEMVLTEPLCELISASVHEGDLKGKEISHFDVVEQQQTKSDESYSTLWGSSNKSNWGDD